MAETVTMLLIMLFLKTENRETEQLLYGTI